MTREKEIEKEKSVAELEEVYKKFLRLYERFAADRITISKQGETLGEIIDELKAEMELTTEFKAHVRKDVVETLNKAAVEVGIQIENSIQELITKELNDVIRSFKMTLNASREELSESVRIKDENIWYKWFAAIFGICLLTIIFLGFHLPRLYFTSKQVEIYEKGLLLNACWNKLSKKTQIFLKQLGRDDLAPQEGSIEWIKRQNPGMDDEEIQRKFDWQISK